MNKIIWERWKDPLRPLIKKVIHEDEDDIKYRDSIKTFNFKDDEDDEEDEDKEDVKSWKGPVILGPLGIIPILEDNIPSKLYNFWMGDTNFDLTKQLEEDISQINGVETLDIYSRYRFRVGIGRAFKEDLVLKSIDKFVCFDEKEDRNNKHLDNMKKMLTKNYKYWAIILDKQGKYEYLVGNTKNEVESRCLDFRGKCDKHILSWEK